jgi:hypothetical protein
MHRFAAVLLSATLLLGAAACSDDTTSDDTGENPTDNTFDAGENQEFCDQYEVLISDLAAGLDSTDQAAAADDLKASYAAALELAPDDVVDDMTTVNEGIQGATTIAEMVLVTGDEKDATDAVNGWVSDNCGFDPTDV